MSYQVREEYKEIVKKEGNIHLWKKDGYYCMVLRHCQGQGHLNGYVGVPKNSKLYGLKDHYWKPEDLLQRAISEVRVHGGLTYAGKFDYWLNIGDIWWFGFDTCHYNDLAPYYLPGYKDLGIADNGVYRDLEYVKREVNELCEQIKKIDKLAKSKGVRQ